MAAGKMSKMDAVRQAIKELGRDASPTKIQELVKAKFRLEMTTGHVSNYKTAILRTKKGKKTPPAEQESTHAPAAAPAKAAPALAKGSAVSLNDLAAVKGLVGRVGEDDLKSLIGILGG